MVAVGYDTAPTGGCCPAEAEAAGAAPAPSRLCPLPRPHGLHGAAGAAQPGLPGAAVPCHQVGHTPLPGSPAPLLPWPLLALHGRPWPCVVRWLWQHQEGASEPRAVAKAWLAQSSAAQRPWPLGAVRGITCWAGVRVRAAASSAWSSVCRAASAAASLLALAHGSPSPEAFTCVDTRREPTWQPWCCPRTGRNMGWCQTSKVAPLCPEPGLPLG